MKRVRFGVVAGLLALPLVTTGTASGAVSGNGYQSSVRDDHYRARSGQTLQIGGDGVLGNDALGARGRALTSGGAVVRHTAPAHGSLTIGADGTFRYTPAPGFHGQDTFTYTASDAVRLYPTNLPPLATIGGVPSPAAPTVPR